MEQSEELSKLQPSQSESTKEILDLFKKKKQIFQVLHKREKTIRYIDNKGKKYRTFFKCIYCDEISRSNNRFNTHMRKHVRINLMF